MGAASSLQDDQANRQELVEPGRDDAKIESTTSPADALACRRPELNRECSWDDDDAPQVIVNTTFCQEQEPDSPTSVSADDGAQGMFPRSPGFLGGPSSPLLSFAPAWDFPPPPPPVDEVECSDEVTKKVIDDCSTSAGTTTSTITSAGTPTSTSTRADELKKDVDVFAKAASVVKAASCATKAKPRGKARPASKPSDSKGNDSHQKVELQKRKGSLPVADANDPQHKLLLAFGGGGPARKESKSQPSGGPCDKCDGPHATDACPHFKKKRESHKDAWEGCGRGKSQVSTGGVPFIVHAARVVRSPGDGSCLYHSLARGLGPPATGAKLRKDLAAYVETHPNVKVSDTPLKEWVLWDSNSTVKEYAKKMSSGRQWGGAIEIAACAQLHRVSVHVYEAQRGSSSYVRISTFDIANSSQTLHVLYSGRSHYDALEIDLVELVEAERRCAEAAKLLKPIRKSQDKALSQSNAAKRSATPNKTKPFTRSSGSLFAQGKNLVSMSTGTASSIAAMVK